MVKLFSLLIFLFSFVYSFSQTTEQRSVYFKTDKAALDVTQINDLMIWLDSIKMDEAISVKISGHTDSDADSIYNINLSQNRCVTVQNILIKEGVDQSLIRLEHYGENNPMASNSTVSGKQKNRRVDIIVQINEENISIVEDEIPLLDPCEGIDTTIVFADGTRMVFNKCEFLELEECLEITLWNDIRDAREDGVEMRDENGMDLVSSGMFNIQFDPACTERTCFRNPVRILIPVPSGDGCDFCGPNGRRYIMNDKGAWVLQDDKALDIVVIDDQKFYTVEIMCAGKVNFDCKLPDGVKVKLKVPAGYRITAMELVNECPRAIVNFSEGKSNKRVRNLPCWDGWLVYATIVDKKGNEIVINDLPLNDIPDKGVLFSKCGKDKNHKTERILGIFKGAERGHYRKYKLSKRYLETFQKE